MREETRFGMVPTLLGPRSRGYGACHVAPACHAAQETAGKCSSYRNAPTRRAMFARPGTVFALRARVI